MSCAWASDRHSDTGAVALQRATTQQGGALPRYHGVQKGGISARLLLALDDAALAQHRVQQLRLALERVAPRKRRGLRRGAAVGVDAAEEVEDRGVGLGRRRWAVGVGGWLDGLLARAGDAKSGRAGRCVRDDDTRECPRRRPRSHTARHRARPAQQNAQHNAQHSDTTNSAPGTRPCPRRTGPRPPRTAS